MKKFSIYAAELKEEDYYPQISAYYFKQWNQFDMEFHSHIEVEVMYIIEGECIVETKGDAFHFTKGEFVLIDSFIEHRLIVRDSCKMLNIEFYFTKDKPSLLSMKQLITQSSHMEQFLNMKKPYVTMKHSDEVYHLLQQIVFESDQHNRDDIVSLMLGQLLIHLARLGIKTKEAQSQMQLANRYVERVIQYIYYHYDENIQMEDLAGSVNLHPNYLHRIFKQVMNETVVEYLTKLRVNRAKNLLRNTDMPIIEITHNIGMNSSQYFSQVFKKQVGMTPREYRNKGKQEIEKFRES